MSWKPWTIKILFISHEMIRNNGITWYLQNLKKKKNKDNYISLTREFN